MRRHSPRTLLVVASLAGALVVTGCATTEFGQGSTTIGVKPPPPPPPPEPPPPPPKPEPPPLPPKRVTVTAERITISEKIQFDLGKATIKPESDSLITEISDVIKTNPQIKKIRIEGHASKDKPGEEKTDLTLSDDRAKAVLEALVAKGVKKEILISKGFGETQPIAPNDTEEGREKNRRVDFVIVDPAPPKVAPPKGTAKPTATPKPAAPPKPAPAGKK